KLGECHSMIVLNTELVSSAVSGNKSRRGPSGLNIDATKPAAAPPKYRRESTGQALRPIASPTARAPSQAINNGNEPWEFTHTHTIGTSSQTFQRRSTTSIESATQM